MSDQDIFNKEEGSKTTPTDQVADPSSDAVNYADQLASITNEDGEQKYSTIEDALKGLQSAQSHIKTIEQENNNFKTELSGASKMDDILKAINSNKQESIQTPQTSLDTGNVKDVALAAIMEHEANKTATQNQNTVATTLKEKFGEKAQEMYEKKAKDLGLSVQSLNDLSAMSPNAALRYFDSDKQDTSASSSQGTINTSALNTSGDETPTKYDGLMWGAGAQAVNKAWKEQADKVLAQYQQ